MQTNSPYQASKPNRLWTRLVAHAAKPYLVIPGVLLLIIISGLGAWAVLSQPPTPQKEASQDSAATDLSRENQDEEVQVDKETTSTNAKKDSTKSNSKSSKKSTPKNDKSATKTIKNTLTTIGSGISAGSSSGNGSVDTGSNPTPPSPVGLAKPTSSNTGPRYSIQRSLTAAQALSELRETGRLSRVHITGSLKISGSDGRNWVIEDSIITTTFDTYGLQAYVGLNAFTGAKSERPIFRHVEIIGRAATTSKHCAAVVFAQDIVLEHADIYGCDDGLKAANRVDLISSWIHDLDRPSGAHCDAIQIQYGKDILVRGSRLDAYAGYSSDGYGFPSDYTCNAGLQTGAVTNTISALFENNWFAGGYITIRGDSDSRVSYVFRDNKWMRTGTSVSLGRTDLVPHRYDPTSGSLGNFNSTNVWEDTGQPVR